MIKNLFFDAGDISFIKDASDPYLVSLRDEVLSGGSMLDLGIRYALTKDSTALDRAREMLFSVADGGGWFDSDYSPDAYNGYDIRCSLGTASRCRTMAEGLSLFGEYLPESEVRYLAVKTLEKGVLPTLREWVLPGTRIHALDTMGHNFWCVIISGAAAALTVVRDYADNWEYLISEAAEALKGWFLYKGNPINMKPVNSDDGGYWEGVNYFDYACGEYLRFANIYLRQTGKHPFDDEEILRAGGRFLVECGYLSDEMDYSVGFCDCNPENEFRRVPLLLTYYGLGSPELSWHILTRKEQKEEPALRLLTWKTVNETPCHPPEKLSSCYERIGWAMFRSSWEKNSDMLAVKCGDTWNHAHADAGHFILYRKGRPEIYDSMVNDYSEEAHYISYFADSKGHNVVLFDGRGQDYRDNYKNHCHTAGRLIDFTDGGRFRYVMADCTGPESRWMRKHHRHFLWAGSFILIYDDIECYEPGKVSFLLHAEDDSCFEMLTPHTVSEMIGWAPEDLSERKYLSFDTMSDDDGHAKFVSLLRLDDSAAFRFDDIVDGWRLDADGCAVYINRRSDGRIMHRNCINTMDGIMTDAVMIASGNGGYFAVNASIIRKDGRSILDSFSRITGYFPDGV